MQDEDKKPGLFTIVGSVLASFIGVQSDKNRERDFTHGKPIHFIIAGVALTALFIFVVLMAVKFALYQAGV